MRVCAHAVHHGQLDGLAGGALQELLWSRVTTGPAACCHGDLSPSTTEALVHLGPSALVSLTFFASCRPVSLLCLCLGVAAFFLAVFSFLNLRYNISH